MGTNTRNEIKQFGEDLIQGLREGPLVFFAPVIAIWRLFNATTEQLVRESRNRAR